MGCPVWQIPKAPHPYNVTGVPRQRNVAQMNEQIKTPEKIQLSNEEIAILSDAEFTTLVIRMLTEMVEFGHKIEEKVKAMTNEIKENVQGTHREGNWDLNQQFGAEERNKQSTRTE